MQLHVPASDPREHQMRPSNQPFIDATRPLLYRGFCHGFDGLRRPSSRAPHDVTMHAHESTFAPVARPRRTRTLLALALCALAVPASATLYKWTDANGRVVYSDQPPPGDVKTQIVQGAPPPSNPNAVKDMANKDLELKKRAKDAAEKEKKDETARAEQVRRNEQCTRVENQIRQLAAEQLALVRVNEKGETVYVDNATRRKEREDLAAWQRQNCGAGAPAAAATSTK